MRMNRRLVLKGMALSSAAGLAMGAPLSRLAGRGDRADPPLLALVNDAVAGSMFVQGATVSAPGVVIRRVGADLAFVLDLDRRLRSGRPMRIIGLLDDASATFVVALARSAGARVPWLGQHTAADGSARHRVLSAARDRISEERLSGTARRERSAAQLGGSGSHTAAWPSTLGYLLASADMPPASVLRAPSRDSVLHGSFVSFSIEI